MEWVRGRCTNHVSSSFICDHLISEILLRTPASSVLKFKSVCKQWCSFIKDPQFIRKHSDHPQKNPSFALAVLCCPTDHRGHTLTTFEEEEELTMDGIAYKNKSKVTIHEEEITTTEKYMLSCNGLLCIKLSHITICNPTTKEIVTLPVKPNRDRPLEVFGLGYDSLNRRYKVVELLAENPYRAYTLKKQFPQDVVLNVYTLGDASNSWRTTKISTANDEDFPCRDESAPRNDGNGRHVDGWIYWLIGNYCTWLYTSVLFFDVRLEKFRLKKLPNNRFDFNPLRYGTTLVELKEKRLGLVELRQEQHTMDVWMLKEDTTTMQDLWIKDYSIDVSFINDNFSTPNGRIPEYVLEGIMNKKLLLRTSGHA